MVNFWHKLKKPFFILAPMEGVTDTVFRQIIAGCGKPDVFFTEFVSVDGMYSRGRSKVIESLKFSPIEKPLVAQLWGLQPENYYKAAREISGMGFDGIDINMGCPQRKVVRKGACAALINNPGLAREIIRAAQAGAPGLPISVKTRIGYKTIQTEDWCAFLLCQNLDALTIHGRTAAQKSVVPALWDEIGKVVKLRDRLKSKTLIIGNGDVINLDDAREKVREFQVDGVMVGRGIFHNPWFFGKTPNEKCVREKLDLLLYHCRLFEKVWGDNRPFSVMRKYFKIYANGFTGATGLRMKLVRCGNITEVEKLINDFVPSN